MISFNKNKKGFTLVEILIAMAVGLVIMAAIYSSMNLAQHSTASIGRKVMTQQDARAVLGLMAMEIRMVSFNRWYDSKPNLWSSVPACGAMGFAVSVKERKGIQIATANSLLVAMDLNADGIIGPPARNEYIFYQYNAGTGTITRNVQCGGNQPMLGGAGSSTMIRNNLTTPAATPLFQYFDESGTDISATVANCRRRMTTSPSSDGFASILLRKLRHKAVLFM